MAVWSHVHAGAWIVLEGRYRRWWRTGRQRWRRLPRWLLAGPVLRDALSRICCVRITLPVPPVVQWHIRLVAFAHFDGRGALARPGFARVVVRAAHVKHRVLRYPAIKVAFRGLWVVLEASGPLLLDRQESGGACRRPAEVQVEAQVGTEVILFGVSVGYADRLDVGRALWQLDQKSFEVVPVGDPHLA